MDHRTELVDVIRRVRNRWRMRLAAARARSSSSPARCSRCCCRPRASSRSGSAPPAIIAFRILAVAVFVGLLSSTALVWPLRRQVTDAQVALYLEERDPSLEAAILSAVEATARRRIGGALAAARREAGRAGDRRSAAPLDDGTAIERAAVQRHAVDAGGVRRASPR